MSQANNTEQMMNFFRLHLDHMVLGVLGFMSFLMIAFVIERSVYFFTIKLEKFDHIELLKAALTRNLTTISTVAANAPYVGLLGTVIGILVTFYDMGQNGDINVNQIMVGLAMALKATAAGLVVAIPAIIFYNGLMRRVDTKVALWVAMVDKQTEQNQ